MKSVGMVRPVDKMGRVVIPQEFRNMLDVKNGVDSFEIMMNGEEIVLRKYQPTCIFCDSFAECVEYEGKMVCLKCIEKLNLKQLETSEN